MSNKLFENFNFNIIDESHFGEAAVREEIVTPILKKLGYSASGENEILYNKALKHPYSYEGIERSKKISKFPDYLLRIKKVNVLVLDAKAPNVNIRDEKNLGQVFSYARNREGFSPYYGLCNGREIIIFHILDLEPKIHFPITQINERWNELYCLIGPIAFTNPDLLDIKPDFGLLMQKQGISFNHSFIFPDFQVAEIWKLKDDLYSIEGIVKYDNEFYFVSFHFNHSQFGNFVQCVPNRITSKVSQALKQQPYFITLDKAESFDLFLTAGLSKIVVKNDVKEYIPLIVEEFKSFPDAQELTIQLINNIKNNLGNTKFN